MPPGQPPRITYPIRSSSEGSRTVCTPTSWPLQTSNKETAHADAPLSCRDMGCMARRAILPVPECSTPFCFGVVEPVRMYRPLSVLSSTEYRTASQMAGTSCHSSIRCGASPSNARLTSSVANFRFAKFPAGCPTRNSLLECIVQVHVFPHHLGPSTQTAPNVER